MKINDITLTLGAKTPFTVYHMSDNHLCRADERECDRKRDLAAKRGAAFRNAEQYTAEMIAEVRAAGCSLVHTGDLADFVSRANYEAVMPLFKGIQCFFAAGNHEFSQYVGEAWEDEPYKALSLADAVASFPEGFLFGTHTVNGIRFLTLDNNYYYVTEAQFLRFKRTLADGVPTVLCVHNPLYSEDLYNQIIARKGADTVPYLFGCPEEKLRHLTEYRYKQQTPNETTLAFLDFCNHCPNLVAVLAGHLHDGYISQLDSGIPQIVANGAYRGEMNRYRIQ